MPGDIVRHAAQQDALHSFASVGTDHDQGGVPMPGGVSLNHQEQAELWRPGFAGAAFFFCSFFWSSADDLNGNSVRVLDMKACNTVFQRICTALFQFSCHWVLIEVLDRYGDVIHQSGGTRLVKRD